MSTFISFQMLSISCAFVGFVLILIGSSCNGLCIVVFLRKTFRRRIVTPFFIVLLIADSIYLALRLIKLLYYSQTLFKSSTDSKQTCSNTSIYRFFQHATQFWPQIFVPLIHSETYIRFSLILMSIVTVQRTAIITKSLKHLSLQNSTNERQKMRSAIFYIGFAFFTAYFLEFFGLTLFCSKSNDRQMTFNWFVYMSQHMKNSTILFKNTLKSSPEIYQCVNDIHKRLKRTNDTLTIFTDSICSKDELMNILSLTFDQHQRSIVNLIQNVLFHQTGHQLTRNEIRRRFHFHECFFRQDSTTFQRYYHFYYDRTFGVNRYTLILILGSIFPSLTTIISNMLSIYRVRHFNRISYDFIRHCRRRTDDTRRVLFVITIECLVAIFNTWFFDIIFSVIFCKKKLSADDDCPRFLEKNSHFLIVFDLFNSVSTIFLHCLSGQHFRRELFSIFSSSMKFLQFRRSFFILKKKNIENPTECLYLRASVSRLGQKNCESSEIILTIRTSTKRRKKHFFHFGSFRRCSTSDGLSSFERK